MKTVNTSTKSTNATPAASVVLYDPISWYKYQGSVVNSSDPKSAMIPKSPREKQKAKAIHISK